MCADNFFSSVSLVEYLWQQNLSYIGTLRKNKKEIPLEFLPHKHRRVHDCLFGFNRFTTIVSYVPKINKSVILISSAHHNQDIDESSSKPQMILDYNKKKCGVDVLDQLIEKYSCRRKSNRWPFTVMMFILDTAAYNSHVLFALKNAREPVANLQRYRCVNSLLICAICIVNYSICSAQ